MEAKLEECLLERVQQLEEEKQIQISKNNELKEKVISVR